MFNKVIIFFFWMVSAYCEKKCVCVLGGEKNWCPNRPQSTNNWQTIDPSVDLLCIENESVCEFAFETMSNQLIIRFASLLPLLYHTLQIRELCATIASILKFNETILSTAHRFLLWFIGTQISFKEKSTYCWSEKISKLMAT